MNKIIRPILIACLGFLIGIIWGLYLKISIAFICILVVIICTLYIKSNFNLRSKILNKKIIKFFYKPIIILAIMSSIGDTYTKFCSNMYEQIYLSSEIEDLAIVISEEKQTEYKKVYTIKTIGKLENKKFILKINKNSKTSLKYGDVIKVKGEYESPSVARNYKGFDYSKYLKSKGIYGTIYSQDNNIKLVEYNQINILDKCINNARNAVITNSKKLIENTTISGLLIGILVGDTGYIDDKTQDDFKNSSLAHMLAVSGQHVAYIIIAINFALKVSKLGKIFGKIISICILIFFMLMTGLTPSVTRAGIMGILIILSSLFYRKSDIYTNLALSMLIILFSNPFAIFDVGLWLSYAGTLGIILFQRIINDLFTIKIQNVVLQKIIDFIKEMLVITIAAQIIIIPIMALNFNQISLMFWLSNVLASPIIAICIIYGFILIFISFIYFPLAQILAIPIELLINIIIIIAEKTANIPFANLLVTTPKTSFVIIYYIGLIILLYCKRENKKQYKIEKTVINNIKNMLKNIVALMTIICIISYGIKIVDKKLCIFFIDVGQGDSTLIITRKGKKVLIDGGGSDSTYDVGKNVLLPYLLDRGIKKIDFAMISHFDSDHCLRSFYNYGKIDCKKCYYIKTNRKFRKL